jgi:hypothetical protein
MDTIETTDPPIELEPMKRLTRDIKDAGRRLGPREARYLVDLYYEMQEHRTATDNQTRACVEAKEPNEAVNYFGAQFWTLERQVQSVLDAYSIADPLGQWARSVVGIGPVIAAGLLAHIDLTKAPTVGHIWRFAGLDPTLKWDRGNKRPWNASLKVLCWKAGESFVKFSGRDDCFYGRVWAKRKAEEEARNAAGTLADQAKAALEAKRFRKETKARACYESGILPPAHVHARAKRYAVKLFLSHYWETGRKLAGLPVPLPYPIAQLGHAHKIEPGEAIAPE